MEPEANVGEGVQTMDASVIVKLCDALSKYSANVIISMFFF